jgi:hypothetical protein
VNMRPLPRSTRRMPRNAEANNSRRNTANDNSWGNSFGGGSTDIIESPAWGNFAGDGGGWGDPPTSTVTRGWEPPTSDGGWASTTNKAGRSSPPLETVNANAGGSWGNPAPTSGGDWSRPPTSGWAISATTSGADLDSSATGLFGAGDVTSGVNAGDLASKMTGRWRSGSVKESGEISAKSETGSWGNSGGTAGGGWSSNEVASKNNDGSWKPIDQEASEMRKEGSCATPDIGKPSPVQQGGLARSNAIPESAGSERGSTTTDGLSPLGASWIATTAKGQKTSLGQKDLMTSQTPVRSSDDVMSSRHISDAVPALRGSRSGSISSIMQSPSVSFASSLYGDAATPSDIKTRLAKVPKTSEGRKEFLQTIVR